MPATKLEKTIIKPSGAAPALGPYSHGVRCGDLLFCAGQIPVDPAQPNAPLPVEIKAQTERVLENIKLILADQGLTLAHVVKSTVFLADLGEFAAMNEVYGAYFTEAYPARSTHQVASLPRGARVENEVNAQYRMDGAPGMNLNRWRKAGRERASWNRCNKSCRGWLRALCWAAWWAGFTRAGALDAGTSKASVRWSRSCGGSWSVRRKSWVGSADSCPKPARNWPRLGLIWRRRRRAGRSKSGYTPSSAGP
jgi:2-iminobutanoate/2-iminopropanoate deaminase